MSYRSFLAVLLLPLAGCAAAAGSSPAPRPGALAAAPTSYTPAAPLPGAVAVSFVLPRGGTPPPFFDLPWPTDLLRRPDGRPDFRSFPGRDALLFGAYVATAEADVDGYSVAPAVYFHFTGDLADLRLPAAVGDGSAADPYFLVDVDPTSPERGTFVPLEHRYYPSALRFVPAHTLAVKPVAGLVLRPGTLYAAVVRRDLGIEDLGTTMDLEVLKWTSPREDPREEAARRTHAGAFDDLASLGAPRERIAGIALFRTQVPHAVTARLFEAVTHLPKGRAPRVISAAWIPLARRHGRGSYLALEGAYCTPNFQSDIERAPFLAEDGGHITFDGDGSPRLVDVPATGPYGSGECQGLMRARFVLTVPTSPMPEAGFPLLVSAHGTGGDAESFLGEDDFAGWAASRGIAVVSTDQPLHGGRGLAPRPGSLEPISVSLGGVPVPIFNGPHAVEGAFYNPIHPGAARDNLRQAAVDPMVLGRLFGTIDLGTARSDRGALLLRPTRGRTAPRFDGRVIAAGHSQGSQSVAILGALDPLVRGVILSGCGGDARLGVLRRHDIPVVSIFSTVLGLETDELDALHPLMTLVQTLADPIDPASYARLYWEPLPGRQPQSVLHYEGMTDSYTPPVTAEVLAMALHLTPLSPVVKRLERLHAAESVLGDLLAKTGPTQAFAQFRATQAENGHFVLFHEPGAAELAMDFMSARTR